MPDVLIRNFPAEDRTVQVQRLLAEFTQRTVLHLDKDFDLTANRRSARASSEPAVVLAQVAHGEPLIAAS